MAAVLNHYIKKNQRLVLVNFITNYAIAVFLFASILMSSNLKIFDRIRGVDDFVNPHPEQRFRNLHRMCKLETN